MATFTHFQYDGTLAYRSHTLDRSEPIFSITLSNRQQRPISLFGPREESLSSNTPESTCGRFRQCGTKVFRIAETAIISAFPRTCTRRHIIMPLLESARADKELCSHRCYVKWKMAEVCMCAVFGCGSTLNGCPRTLLFSPTVMAAGKKEKWRALEWFSAARYLSLLNSRTIGFRTYESDRGWGFLHFPFDFFYGNYWIFSW